MQVWKKAACLWGVGVTSWCVKNGCDGKSVRAHYWMSDWRAWQTSMYCCDGFQRSYPWQQQEKVTGDVILIRIQPSAGGDYVFGGEVKE